MLPSSCTATHWDSILSVGTWEMLQDCVPAPGPPALLGLGVHGGFPEAAGGQSPFICGSSCLQSEAPTPNPCPPINPRAGILCLGMFGESHGCLLGSGTH